MICGTDALQQDALDAATEGPGREELGIAFFVLERTTGGERVQSSHHPPCRGVMISISSPAFSAVSAQRLFGTTS